MEDNKRFLSYLLPQKKAILLIAVSVLIFLGARLSQPFLVGKALDAALESNQQVFRILVIVTLSLSVFGAVFDFIFEYTVGVMTQKRIRERRNDIYHKFNKVPIAVLFKQTTGDLVQLEIGDVENVATGLFSVFKSLIEGILSIILTIVLRFCVNWILALAAVLLSPLSLFVSRFVAKFSHAHFKKQAKLQSALNGISLEAINNSDVLQSRNYQQTSFKKFKDEDDVLKAEGKTALFSASWTNPTTRFVNNIIYALIGISGIIRIGYSATYPILSRSIGKLSSFLSYTTEYTKPFNEISGVLGEYEAAKFSFARINKFLNYEEDVDEGRKEVAGIKEIKFDHRWFSYEPDQRLIEDFNEKISHGEKVAIVGPTGAGKSTLVNVLRRFYDPVQGAVLYNGIKGTDIKKSSLRSNFGMVLQETWIFSGTIRENVRYAKPDATDEEVIDACKRSHADTFIQTLPEGYQTKVSAKEGLSDGERQRITISRVRLLEPDIVILDEATSNVDTRTEKLITDAFDQLLMGKTSIVIAHRLSTIREADLILVLKDGHIIESGNHDTLRKKQGFYYQRYSSQFK